MMEWDFILKYQYFDPKHYMEKAFVSVTLLSQRILLTLETKTKKLSVWPLEMCRSEAGLQFGSLWGCREWDCSDSDSGSVIPSQASPQTPSRGWHQGMSMFYPWNTSISAVPAPSPAHSIEPGQGEALRTNVPAHPGQLTRCSPVLGLSCDDKNPLQL